MITTTQSVGKAQPVFAGAPQVPRSCPVVPSVVGEAGPQFPGAK